jgi:hypothetical protein
MTERDQPGRSAWIQSRQRKTGLLAILHHFFLHWPNISVL